MAESVVVGVRVRPFNDREKALEAKLCVEMNGPNTVLHGEAKDPHEPPPKPKEFTFDESFWSHDGFEDDGTGYMRPQSGSNYSDQRYVFEVFGQRVLNNAWDGFHCCLFAYGQTGSGKSYSMVGYGANKGIVPISCEEIFLRIEKNDVPDKRFEVTVSMIEIYNEAVQDLLIPIEDRPKKGLEIRESKHLGIYIDGVTKRPVDSYESIEQTIKEATEHRTVGATLMNATSSRAHTVQIIEFKQIEKVGGQDSIKVSMVNLVDLAGSEKAGQTGATGDRLKEGSAINKSLSALGNVIEKLADAASAPKGKKVLIPYRDSKLTRLLQNALGGSSKTIMICALSPASSNYEETLSTLRYADRAKKIKNNVTVNEDPQARLLRELKEENDKLKAMMAAFQEKDGRMSVTELTQLRDKQEEVAEVEAALEDLHKSFTDKLVESKEKTQQQKKKEKKRGSILIEEVPQHLPELVNLNADPMMSGKMAYPLPEGMTMRVGNNDSRGGDNDSGNDSGEEDEIYEPEKEPEILLMHNTVFEKHATLLNKNNECVLCSDGKAQAATFVNGTSMAELIMNSEAQGQEWTGVTLKHGDRLIFGQCCFFYCDPRQSLPSVMLSEGIVSYDKAMMEVHKAHEESGDKDDSKKKVIGNVRKVMRGVSIFQASAATQQDMEIATLQEEVENLKEEKAQAEKEAAMCLAKLMSKRAISTQLTKVEEAQKAKEVESLRAELASMSLSLSKALAQSVTQRAISTQNAKSALDDIRKALAESEAKCRSESEKLQKLQREASQVLAKQSVSRVLLKMTTNGHKAAMLDTRASELSSVELSRRIDKLQHLLDTEGSSVAAPDAADEAMTALERVEASLATLAQRCASLG